MMYSLLLSLFFVSATLISMEKTDPTDRSYLIRLKAPLSQQLKKFSTKKLHSLSHNDIASLKQSVSKTVGNVLDELAALSLCNDNKMVTSDMMGYCLSESPRDNEHTIVLLFNTTDLNENCHDSILSHARQAAKACEHNRDLFDYIWASRVTMQELFIKEMVETIHSVNKREVIKEQWKSFCAGIGVSALFATLLFSLKK